MSIEDRLRSTLNNTRYDLPAWPEPLVRLEALYVARRRRQRIRSATTVAAVIVVVLVAAVCGVHGSTRPVGLASPPFRTDGLFACTSDDLAIGVVMDGIGAGTEGFDLNMRNASMHRCVIVGAIEVEPAVSGNPVGAVFTARRSVSHPLILRPSFYAYTRLTVINAFIGEPGCQEHSVTDLLVSPPGNQGTRSVPFRDTICTGRGVYNFGASHPIVLQGRNPRLNTG